MSSYDYTSFGQIEIYNIYYPYNTNITILNNPSQCINNKLSYVAIIENKRIPIMIGSDIHLSIHKNDNPIEMYGYFIIDGICKSLSLILMMSNTLYTKDRAYISESRRISIISMGNYELTLKGKTTKWNLPINYDLIYRKSVDMHKLKTHLDLVAKTKKTKFSKEISEDDAVILCYMFENWLGITNNVNIKRRLITPGELIYDCIKHEYDVVKFFRTHNWVIKNIQNVTSISEDMKHYSILGDIESIRRITFPTAREHMSMKERLVKDEYKYLICPVQTSDGSLCGTILYLSKDARITHKNTDYEIIHNDASNCNNIHNIHNNIQTNEWVFNYNASSTIDEYYLFIDGKFNGKVKDVKVSNNDNIYKDDRIIIVWTHNGRIYNPIKDRYVSVTADYIPFITHNPAVRAMFTCSMIKQALTVDNRLKLPFNDVKWLIKGEQPIIGKSFPTPYGWNLKTAIMPWYGFNIEDAVVISKSTSKKYMSVKQNCYSCRLESSEDRILNVYVKVGDYVSKGSELFKSFKPSQITTIENVRSNHVGIVSSILYNPKCFTIVVRNYRNIKIGDKMSNRHGQKGIVSLILDDEYMPQYYDDSENAWINIDLLINPHAFPGRMTYGQIKEMGEKEYNVRFNDGNGNIKNVKNKILVGICYYMALRHQVDDKIQYRDFGQIDNITKQAKSGKSKNGGLRFGSMERDIMIAIGCHDILEEIYKMDKTIAYSCSICGFISTHIINKYCDGFKDCLTNSPNNKKDVNEDDKCTFVKINCNQYLLICCSLLRSNGYDIRYWYDANEYSIVDYSENEYNKTNDLFFGDTDLLDVRFYKNTPVLPCILRSTYLNNLYSRFGAGKKIIKEHKRLLFGKNGAYHRLVEGHKINHCLRSVIVPNPELPIDTIEIPFGSDIGTSYGLLNRQPSLSYKSIMSVKLVIGNTQCIRINPLLCSSFNADFDGDEMCVYGMNKIYTELPVRPIYIQDYILGISCSSDNNHSQLLSIPDNKKEYRYPKHITEDGLTANKEGIYTMINNKSKGKDFNFKFIYERIGDVIVQNEKIGTIESCYQKGLSDDEWYLQAKAAREAASTIGIYTPYTGELNSICNKKSI